MRWSSRMARGFRSSSPRLRSREGAVAGEPPIPAGGDHRGPDSAGEAILFWERSHEEWKPFGAPRMDGATVPNLFVGQPFIHVDAEDFVYFVDGQRVLKSTRPVE
jgi:hypothetical protein